VAAIKLYTSALAGCSHPLHIVTNYTHAPINKLAIVMALG